MNPTGYPQNILLPKFFLYLFKAKPICSGTGPKFSLSYDIVKAHGGEIDLETEEVKETVLITTLPI